MHAFKAGNTIFCVDSKHFYLIRNKSKVTLGLKWIKDKALAAPCILWP